MDRTPRGRGSAVVAQMAHLCDRVVQTAAVMRAELGRIDSELEATVRRLRQPDAMDHSRPG